MSAGTIRIVCSAPVVAQGLRDAFAAAGWTTTDPATNGSPVDLTVVFVRTSRGVAEVKEARAGDPAGPIVALTDHTDADLTADLVLAGATSVVAWDTPVATLLSIVELAASGVACIGTDALRWICEHGGGEALVTESEADWLRHLADGVTIAELAPLAGYSERSLYRQLNALYHRLGVEDRAGAIAEARRRALLPSS